MPKKIKCKCGGCMKPMSNEEYVKETYPLLEEREYKMTLLANLLWPKPWKCQCCGEEKSSYDMVKDMCSVIKIDDGKKYSEVYYLKPRKPCPKK